MTVRRVTVSRQKLIYANSFEAVLKEAGFDLSRSYYRSFDPRTEEYTYEQKVGE